MHQCAVIATGQVSAADALSEKHITTKNGASGGLVTIDPATDKLTVIKSFVGKDCRPVAAAPDGLLYTSANGVLYRIRIKSLDAASNGA